MRIARPLLGPIVAAFALTLSALPSAAQNWPTRAVKLILPLGPGSGVDISARLIADKLSAKWGQPVVIENRPGGDGIVAISAFAGAKDDHVLLMSPTSSFTAHPYLHDKLPYDPRDLAPIARISNTIVAVVVPASSDIKTVKDLVETARANPGKLNWATITGMFDFVFAGFQKKMGIDIAKVPYRDTVQAINDLAEGRIQVMMAAIAIARPRVQGGAIRMIAVTAIMRIAPASTRGRTIAIADIMTWMRPSARSFTACTVSRYGTLAMSIPIFFWNPANTKSNMPVRHDTNSTPFSRVCEVKGFLCVS